MNFMLPITETVLSVENLQTHFLTGAGVVKAVNGVSFELKRGERLAIVGESGSGKSALAMSLIRLLAYPGKLAGGRVIIGGRDIVQMSEPEMNDIRGNEIATIFQDPMSSLDPVMRVGDQMIPPIMRRLGLTRRDAEAAAIHWLDKVGIPDAKDRIAVYPFEMSGGMRQRVMIAMALSCNPRLIIADEPTTALDVTIQAQIVELLKNLSIETGAAMLFITHDLGLVARFAHKVGVMYAGKLVEIGSAAQVFQTPRHPYTQNLLRTIPNPSGARRERLLQIPGFPPDMRDPPAGCAFRERCTGAHELCADNAPALTVRDVEHSSACWLPDGLSEAYEQSPPQKRLTHAQRNKPASVPQQDVLEVHDLHKHFGRRSTLAWGRSKTVRALNGISLRMSPGETLGIVGESGCGKSTFARLLLGLDEATAGQIFIAGRAQMVFQDPTSSFNPKMSISSIIEEPLVVTGWGDKAKRKDRVRTLIKQVGLEESYLERYPNQLSGGQRQRVGVARALALNPSVVVADEPTSALDVSVRAQIINLLCDIKEEFGVSFVFISHDLLTVRYISDKIAVMYLGEIVEYGPAEDVFTNPMHPYTAALLDAIPIPDPAMEAMRKITILSGELPSPSNIPPGCSFATRCPKASDRCKDEKPRLTSHTGLHKVSCHHVM